jgi:hypothetical protein
MFSAPLSRAADTFWCVLMSSVSLRLKQGRAGLWWGCFGQEEVWRSKSIYRALNSHFPPRLLVVSCVCIVDGLHVLTQGRGILGLTTPPRSPDLWVIMLCSLTLLSSQHEPHSLCPCGSRSGGRAPHHHGGSRPGWAPGATAMPEPPSPQPPGPPLCAAASVVRPWRPGRSSAALLE